jgi:hypothetical protein
VSTPGQYNSKQVDDFIYSQLITLKMKVEALGVLTSASLSVIFEQSPALINKVRQSITDISDLTETMHQNEWDPGELGLFRDEIKKALGHLELVEKGAIYSDTFIEVKQK